MDNNWCKQKLYNGNLIILLTSLWSTSVYMSAFIWNLKTNFHYVGQVVLILGWLFLFQSVRIVKIFQTEQNRTEQKRTEQNRNFILFWLGQYVHHLHNHNIYITRSWYQTDMYMYKSYIIVYIQLVDLCSTNTRNKKVSIQKLRMKNIN